MSALLSSLLYYVIVCNCSAPAKLQTIFDCGAIDRIFALAGDMTTTANNIRLGNEKDEVCIQSAC